MKSLEVKEKELDEKTKLLDLKLAAGSSDEAQKVAADSSDVRDDGEWIPINPNCYGAFIHRAITAGLWDIKKGAMLRYFPLVLVSWLIQMTFAYQLWLALPDEFDVSFP